MKLLEAFAEMAFGIALFPGGSSEFAISMPCARESSEWLRFAHRLLRSEMIPPMMKVDSTIRSTQPSVHSLFAVLVGGRGRIAVFLLDTYWNTLCVAQHKIWRLSVFRTPRGRQARRTVCEALSSITVGVFRARTLARILSIFRIHGH